VKASIALTYALAETGQYASALREFERSRSIWRPGTVDKCGHDASALYQTILACAVIEERVTGETIRSALRKRWLAAPTPLLTRRRPRIGILPFLADDSSGENQIAHSACNDIAVALERFGWFEIVRPGAMVNDRRTSNAIRDRKEHGELDHDIDGAVGHRKTGFTISVRILDMAQHARPVWSDRLCVHDDQADSFADIFAGRAAPFILFIEGRPKPKRRSGTAGLLLLAIPLMYSMERRRHEEAGQLIQCALQLGDARAFAWAAQWGVYHVGQGWSKDTAGTIRRAQQYGLRAIQLDPDNSEALGIYAHVCSFFSKEFDAASRMFDRSLQKNPSSAFIWALSAPTCCYRGDPDTALARIATYRELAPFHPYLHFFQHFYTIALMFKGDYHRAVQFGRRAAEANPGFTNSYKPLIAALGHLGRREEAAAVSGPAAGHRPGILHGPVREELSIQVRQGPRPVSGRPASRRHARVRC
jgi:tetratricopeptide (TPR) repeat protein